MPRRNTQKSEVLELAERQRHAHLVEKVSAGTFLSHAEVRELERYEAELPPEPKVSVAGKPPRRRRGKLSLAEVRQLGMECDNLTEAAVLFSGPGDLIDLMDTSDSVRAAWDRGRLLRGVRALAPTPITVTQAGKRLGMSGPAFRELLDNDAEVADIWDEGQQQMVVNAKQALAKLAEEGKPSAIRYIENYLREELPQGGFDIHRVPISVMEEVTSKSRQTLFAWYRTGGCPRNPDCTYDLPAFLRWFEEYVRGQVRTVAPPDKMRAVKTKLQLLKLEKEQGALLERVAVENGLVTRMQNFLAAIENHLPPTAAECVGKPVEQIEVRMRGFCQKLRDHLCEVPSELKLPVDTARELKAFLGRLDPPPEEDHTDA